MFFGRKCRNRFIPPSCHLSVRPVIKTEHLTLFQNAFFYNTKQKVTTPPTHLAPVHLHTCTWMHTHPCIVTHHSQTLHLCICLHAKCFSNPKSILMMLLESPVDTQSSKKCELSNRRPQVRLSKATCCRISALTLSALLQCTQ